MCVLCYCLVSIVVNLRVLLYCVANCSWPCVYYVIVLWVLLYCVCISILNNVVAGLLATGQYPEGPATGQLGTRFLLGFPVSVYKRMLTWFTRFQVTTTCFSCSPPALNFLVTYFIFMHMHNNHCHWLTAQLQLIIIIFV